MPGWAILIIAFAYLVLLFAIAAWGDRRADQRRSVINAGWIYALSISVYCTSWTFYGSVGRAAEAGVGFLPIYLGPSLVFTLGYFVLRKMIRIAKTNRITSIADFLSSRYGKSTALGGLVTVIALVGIMPYIALQLKAVAASFDVLTQHLDVPLPAVGDTALFIALLMAIFSILFGTRDIDATERHEGMVAAIAFEAIVKLIAFLLVGLFVTFVLFDSPAAIFAAALESPELNRLFTMEAANSAGNWTVLTLLSAAAILCLPRQFQIIVVEAVDEPRRAEAHLAQATWLFPLYLLLINLFVLPIALAGLIVGPMDGGPDTYVLTLPAAADASWVALIAFLGGLSAATGMVIVETVALSIMLSNDLVMPVLLRIPSLALLERADLTRLLLAVRRVSILLVVGLGYLYFRLIGESYALVTIGLVAFAAAAQVAPAMIGGMYWKGATRRGALAGVSAGFLMWLYTLLLPSFARSGWLPSEFIEVGPFGIAALNPYALFGLDGLDPTVHSLFWSMLANVGLYLGVSLFDRHSPIERIQATLFVDVYSQSPDARTASAEFRQARGRAAWPELRALADRFLGRDRAEAAFAAYARRRNIDLARLRYADADLMRHTERLLAGAIGSASARVMVARMGTGEGLTLDEMMEILDEASHVIEYSRQLEQKSAELERASAELARANERLKELDRLKDEFISTVTHELKTPLTSIRSFSEILYDNQDLPPTQRQEFLGIVIKESERLSRLINQVLDLSKIESGTLDWRIEPVPIADIIEDAAAALRQIFAERSVTLTVETLSDAPPARGDRDRLAQVMVNLLANAARFARSRVSVGMEHRDDEILVTVADDGPGIAPEDRETVFETFRQLGAPQTGNPEGTGLGLAISRRIVEHLGGRIWVEGKAGQGATFRFALPVAEAAAPATAR